MALLWPVIHRPETQRNARLLGFALLLDDFGCVKTALPNLHVAQLFSEKTTKLLNLKQKE